MAGQEQCGDGSAAGQGVLGLADSPSGGKFFDRRDWRIAAAIFLLALGVRAAFLYQSRSFPTFYAPIVDSGTYHQLACKLAVNHQWSDGFFWQPFFYPLFLSVIYMLAGPSIVAAKVVQIVLGAATCGLTYAVGKRLLGRRVGVAAGLMQAFYGPLIFLETDLMGDWMLGTWSLVLLLMMLKIQRTRSLWTCFALGLCCELALLTRPTIGPFLLAAGVYLAVVIYRQDGRSATIWAVRNALAGFLVAALPVGMLNFACTGNFAILPSSGGINFYIGNNENTDKTLTIRPGYDWEQLTGWPKREGVVGDRQQQDFYYKKVRQYALAHPADFARGMVAKTLRFLTSREIPRNDDLYMFGQWSPMLRVLAWKIGPLGFPFGLVLPLAGVGLVYWWRRLPVVFKLFVLLYPAAVILVFVTGRYRLPMIPVILILAAGGGAGLIDMFRRRDWGKVGLAAGGMAALLAVATLPGPFVEEKVNFPAELNCNLGIFYLDSKQYEKSAEFLERSISLRPGYSDAYHTLGNVRANQGRTSEALDCYRQAVEANPENAKSMYNIGNVEYVRGNFEAALPWLDRSLAQDATNSRGHYYRGLCLVKLKRADEAGPEYRKAIEQESDKAYVFRIRVSLADLLVTQGRAAEAMQEYREALKPVLGNQVKADPRAAICHLAWLNATSPDPAVRLSDEAMRLGQALVKLDEGPSRGAYLPISLDVLAAAYASAGKFEQAIATGTRALEIAEMAGKPALASKIRERLDLYRAGTAYTQRPPAPPEYVAKDIESPG
jgi:tetratricopeptide (TPR) repeat protein